MIIHKIKSYLFKQIERENIIADPLMIVLFSKLRVIFPIFKKNFIIGFFANILQSILLLSYIYFTYDKFFNNQIIHLILITYSVLHSFIGGLIKSIIVYYFTRVIKENDEFNVLQAKMRQLVKSRIYKWSKKLGMLCYFVNLVQISVSFLYLKNINDFGIIFVNFSISVLFYIRMVFFITKLNRAINQKTSRQNVNEIVKSNKIIKYTESNPYDSCIICFESFVENEELIELKCDAKHIFHSKCLKDWFSYQAICPFCKKLN